MQRSTVFSACSAPSSSAASHSLVRGVALSAHLGRPCSLRSRLRPIAASDTQQDAASRFAREAQERADRFAREAQSSFSKFSKDQKLDERARDLGRSAKEAYEEAQGKARRAFLQLDSEYDLSAKTAKAARRVQEAAKDIDQEYGIRRRLRSTQDYLQRMWPLWQQQLNEFAQHWYGKATIFLGLCLLFSLPFFWKVVNFLVLLWWLSIPVSFALVDYARKKQAERLQQEQQDRVRQAQQQQAGPFADMFRAWRSAAGRGSGGATPGGGAQGRRSSGGKFMQQDGPIIEAEWRSIDEGDHQPKGGRR